jgi:hypothetical protein
VVALHGVHRAAAETLGGCVCVRRVRAGELRTWARDEAAGRQDAVLARLRQLRVLLPEPAKGGGAAAAAAGDAQTFRLHPDVQANLRAALYELAPPPPPTLPPHLQARATRRAEAAHAHAPPETLTVLMRRIIVAACACVHVRRPLRRRWMSWTSLPRHSGRRCCSSSSARASRRPRRPAASARPPTQTTHKHTPKHHSHRLATSPSPA